MSPHLFGAAAGSNGFFLLGLLAFGGIVMAVIIAAILKDRGTTEEQEALAALRSGRPRTTPALAYPVNVVLGNDGFWLEGSTIPPGSLIAYAYLTATQSQAGKVRYAPGAKGQFVYTGTKPEVVDVLHIGADEPDVTDVDQFSSSTTPFDIPTVAWAATQTRQTDSPSSDRPDPPAY